MNTEKSAPENSFSVGALPAHPLANRAIVLSGMRVHYLLQRSRRRSVGFLVGAQGLTVRAPAWLPLSAVDAAVHGKANWIVRKLQERTQRGLPSGARMDWRHGARLPYLGRELQVCLAPGVAAGLQPGPARSARPVGVEAGELLLLDLPHTASASQIQQQVRGWLIQQARQVFTRRLDHFAPLLGVRWTRLGLSQAATRWGSARADGAIRLNWRLLHFAPEVLDYVVVHELSHLREMNHGPRFWAIVAELMPNHAGLRRQLKAPMPALWNAAA